MNGHRCARCLGWGRGHRRACCPGWRRGTIFRILAKSSRSYAQNRIFRDRLGLSRIVGEKIPAYFYLSGSVPTKDGYRPRHRHKLQSQAPSPKQKGFNPRHRHRNKKASTPGTGTETKRLQPQAPAGFIILKISKKKPRHHFDAQATDLLQRNDQTANNCKQHCKDSGDSISEGITL